MTQGGTNSEKNQYTRRPRQLTVYRPYMILVNKSIALVDTMLLSTVSFKKLFLTLKIFYGEHFFVHQITKSEF